MDVIVADIDGGSIRIPESLVPLVSLLSDAIWESIQMSLIIADEREKNYSVMTSLLPAEGALFLTNYRGN